MKKPLDEKQKLALTVIDPAIAQTRQWQDSEDNFSELDKKIDKIPDDIVASGQEIKDSIESGFSDLQDTLKKKLEEELLYEVDEQKIVDSVLKQVKIPEPIPGKDADENKIVQKVLEQIPKEEPIDIESVAKIAASYIPKQKLQKIPKIDEDKIVANVLGKIPKLEPFKFELTQNDLLTRINKFDHDIDWKVLKNIPYDVLHGGKSSGKIGRGGARQFTALTDVPSSYSGQTGKYTRVNASETGLEFATLTPTTPAGSDTQVQFNDGGAFGGDAGLTYNKTTDTLTVGTGAGIVVSHAIRSDATDGIIIESANGTDVGILGAANTANATWYGNHNFSTATQDTIAGFTGTGKTLGSLSTSTYPSLTELSYGKGVTSAIQTQLNNKQTLDADLTALAALTSTGFAVRTATDTWAQRTITVGSSLSISNGNGVSGNPSLSLNLANANTWSATQTFNKADISTPIPPPSNLAINFTPDGSGFFADGTNYSYIIYSYAGGVYDIVGTSNNATDPSDAGNYYVDLTWDSAGAVDGYYVYDANNNQYVDAGNNTSYQVTPATSWSFGSTPSSPSAILTPQNSLTSQGDKDAGTQDINVLEFSSTPLRLYWDYTNQYLRFEDSSLTLKTLRTNINADTITGGTYTGTWNGGVISTTKGGTGLSSWTQGDIPYYTSGTALTKLAKNTSATRYLSNTGTSNAPAWAQINLTNGVTGDLPFANLAQGSALSVLGVTGNSTADVASIAAGTDHQVLRRSGTSLAFGAVNLAQSAAVTGTLPVGNGGTGATTYAQDTLLFGNVTGAIGSATYWKYNEANKQLYWSDGGTNATYGAFYLYDLTHSFKPAMRIDKPTWGSALQMTLSTLSPVIEASGGSTFVSYSQSDTGTYLFNDAPTGSKFTIRNDTDNYGTYGLYAKGYNNNSAPSSSGAAKRAISYGVVGEAQGHTSGNGGAGLRSYSASANMDGVRVDFLSGQTAPLIRARLVDSFYDSNQTVATDYFRIEASGSIWNRLTTMQQQWEYDGSNYANITIGSTGIATFNAVGSGSSFVFSDPVTINGSLTLSAQNIVTDTTTGMKIGTGTTQKIAFYNSTPIVQPTALTVQLTDITYTAPGTPDYAIQDLVDSASGSAFGFATKDEGNTVLSVIKNLQTRVQELEDKLQALGLLA